MGPTVVTRNKALLEPFKRAGCVVSSRLVRSEVRKDVYVEDTEAVWGSGAAVEGFNDDGPRQSSKIESRVIEPAVYETPLPAHVVRVRDPGVALWMLENFGSTEIDAMYRLGDGSFAQSMMKAYEKSRYGNNQ
jgi:hypothetical protein